MLDDYLKRLVHLPTLHDLVLVYLLVLFYLVSAEFCFRFQKTVG